MTKEITTASIDNFEKDCDSRKDWQIAAKAEKQNCIFKSRQNWQTKVKLDRTDSIVS